MGAVKRGGINVTKVDFCMDLAGSFIPENWLDAKE